jgi:hypothetical protein
VRDVSSFVPVALVVTVVACAKGSGSDDSAVAGGAPGGAAAVGGGGNSGTAGTGGDASAGADGGDASAETGGGAAGSGATGGGGDSGADAHAADATSDGGGGPGGSAGTGGSEAGSDGAAGAGGISGSGGVGGTGGAGGADGGLACTLPAAACTNGTQSGYGCGTFSSAATVIGRTAAKAGGGASFSDSLCTFSSDNFNSSACSSDDGNDHGYRIFLRQGETVAIAYTASACAGSSATTRLKVYQATTDCSDPASAACSASATPKLNCVTGAQTYTAPSDGWVAIIMDSDIVGDGVAYTLTVTLDATTCRAAGCECP